MLAFANCLFDQGAAEVAINPDGMHGKQFKIRSWLLDNGYSHESRMGERIMAAHTQTAHADCGFGCEPGKVRTFAERAIKRASKAGNS